MAENTEARPQLGRSFWIAMAAFALLLIAVCVPLYFAAGSFFGDWFARAHEADAEAGSAIFWDSGVVPPSAVPEDDVSE